MQMVILHFRDITLIAFKEFTVFIARKYLIDLGKSIIHILFYDFAALDGRLENQLSVLQKVLIQKF